MDLVAGVSNLKHAEFLGQVQMRVARKLLDAQAMQGAAAIRMIDSASKVATSAGDALVAAATGLGGQLDTVG
jgi:hypothetical protein